MGQVKPNHYLEILKTAWENRDQLPFASRILRHGVCDGCALGTVGMRDFTIEGIHLCTVRLKLLRLNTMPALDHALLEDVSGLRGLDGRQLRGLGRLAYPMLRSAGDKGFRRITWKQAIDIAGARVRRCRPDRLAFYLTSRGVTNEVYYVAQKVARFLGTNNIDNSARICHAPSTAALKTSLGAAASTCSYKDWIGADLIVLAGSNVPNNQPVTTRYLYYAKQRGARIVVVNPYREPGLRRYWVPSVPESALFGTRLADHFYSVNTGGDIAFFNGVVKALIEIEGIDTAFVRDKCSGFEDLKSSLDRRGWESLERCSGASRQQMRHLAEVYKEAKTAVFVWSMGLTQHVCGVQNVASLINLALARGMVGRENCGLMPIRGHSGVQGGAEVGCVPNALPGGAPLDAPSRRRFTDLWGFTPPAEPGLSAVDMIDAAHDGRIEVFYSVGGNFLDTLPDPSYVRQALERVPSRVHQDIVLSPPMLLEPAGEVLLLPARTRYEQEGGGTETTTERYILFNPEIPGRRVGESRSEWEILMEVAKSAWPERASPIEFKDATAIRAEIARAVPFYAGIEKLAKKGDAVQWGGRRLCEGAVFATPDGRARFQVVSAPDVDPEKGTFLLSTRRGKQFNSMVQSDYDPLTGARRKDVLINPEEAASLGLRDGQPVVLRSEAGRLSGFLKFAPIQPRNLQVHWPEGNVLLSRGKVDPVCGIPDYNCVVQLLPAEPGDDAGPGQESSSGGK